MSAKFTSNLQQRTFPKKITQSLPISFRTLLRNYFTFCTGKHPLKLANSQISWVVYGDSFQTQPVSRYVYFRSYKLLIKSDFLVHLHVHNIIFMLYTSTKTLILDSCFFIICNAKIKHYQDMNFGYLKHPFSLNQASFYLR